MKKLLVLSLFAGLSYGVEAQSFDVGLRGGAASTWLFNTNVSNAGNDENYASTISSEFGLHLAINFFGGTGIEAEVISEKYKQNYTGTFENPPGVINDNGALVPYINNESYNATTTLNLIKLPLLFHYEAKGGFSIEVGPEYVILSDANYTSNFSGEFPGTTSSVSYDVKSDFASSDLRAVLGFGWNVKLIPSGKLYLLVDLRFEYGLTDLKGVDGHGQDLDNTSSNNLYTSGTQVYYTYPGYKATNSAEANLSVGLFYRLSWGKAVKGLL